jgi:hypothetical protein
LVCVVLAQAYDAELEREREREEAGMGAEGLGEGDEGDYDELEMRDAPRARTAVGDAPAGPMVRHGRLTVMLG